jgi:hypothetical protein
MTPSDDDLSWLLRRELHAEAARLAAAHDALGQIRGRLGSRSVLQRWWGGLRVDAEQYGLHGRHLAAEAGDAALRLLRFLVGRSGGERHGSRPGLAWLRPVVALAAVCIFAGSAAAVPGVRHAITTIGSSGKGSSTSVNGTGGGSGAGTGQRIGGGGGGGNGAPGQSSGTIVPASPKPSLTCANSAKTVPSAAPTATKPGHATVSPAVSPASSTPAATPTDTPTPTNTPTDPTGSGTPVPASSAPVKNNVSDSSHLSSARPCQGPTLPKSGSASASSRSASQLPAAQPAPTTSETPASTPSTASATPSVSSTPTASVSSTHSGGTGRSSSPWSAGSGAGAGAGGGAGAGAASSNDRSHHRHH